MQYGRTALHEAAREGHAQVCRYLIEMGANLSATDKVSKRASCLQNTMQYI